MSLGSLAQPLCPRCGYDVSGPIPDWTEQCSLHGTCPECGLRYAWFEVFYPDRNDLPGFFEHARGGWLVLLRAAWRTWAWMLLPTRFFQRITVSHRIALKRVAIWLVVLMLPLHALASVLGAVRMVAFPPALGTIRRGATFEVLNQISAWTYPIVSFSPNALGGWFPPSVNWHILWTPMWVPATLLLNAMYAAVCLVLPRTLGAAKVRKAHIVRAFVYGMAWVPLLAAFRAGRNLWLVYQLTFQSNSIGALTRGGLYPFYLDAIWPSIPVAALFGWTMLWWWCAFHRGWKIENAKGVWMLLSVAAVLGVLCYAFWVDELWWMWY